MDAETALRKARKLLAPNGKVLIVGCAKNGKLTDWLIDIGRTPFAWIGTKLHGETNPGVVTRNPTVIFAEMRSLAYVEFPYLEVLTMKLGYKVTVKPAA
ncbi:MAG: hypothetical protein M1379_16815 [Firmicutes bacterium]|nr:hypothetical protein [Bacillota bacterium]